MYAYTREQRYQRTWDQQTDCCFSHLKHSSQVPIVIVAGSTFANKSRFKRLLREKVCTFFPKQSLTSWFSHKRQIAFTFELCDVLKAPPNKRDRPFVLREMSKILPILHRDPDRKAHHRKRTSQCCALLSLAGFEAVTETTMGGGDGDGGSPCNDMTDNERVVKILNKNRA
jgi:hypothetical protein